MVIPYRTRRRLQRIALVALVVLLAALLIWGCWLLWLHKHIRYTSGGAVLDFDMDPISQDGQLALPPDGQQSVSIYYNEGDNAVNTSKELTQLTGYYITGQDLTDIPTLREYLKNLPSGTPVMMDVKNIYGGFYYSSGVSATRSESVDSKEVDKLIQELNQSGAYIIARFPALRDKAYGLEYDENGVFHSSRGYLWVDEEGCYWLNPSREGTLSYITRIVTELKGLGFDEVVLADFQIPRADNTYFEGDRDEALATAAKTLLSTCGSDYFAVSFVGAAGFSLPEGRSRLYVETAAASEVEAIAQQTGLADPLTQLVFLTENHDTRFNTYGVMRPISAAH